MAINTAAAFEVRPTNGSDNNGGGFAIGGNTFSLTDLKSSNGTTTNCSVSSNGLYTFVSGDINSWLYVASGSNWTPGFYQITAVSLGVATLAAPNGVGTTATLTSGTGSIDRSQQASWVNGTNLTVDATTSTKVNPDGYTITVADVGNIINITTTGTGAAFTTGRYQITIVTTGGSQRWQLDQSPAATSSAGATWAAGGAAKTIGEIVGGTARKNMVRSNKCFVKAESTISIAATINPATTAATVTNALMPNRLIGYTTAHGDNGKVTIQASGTVAGGMMTFSTAGWTLENFVFDGNSQTIGQTLNFSGSTSVINCKFMNASGPMLIGGNAIFIENCEFTANTFISVNNTGAGQCIIHLCNFHDNSAAAIGGNVSTEFLVVKNCLFTNNSASAISLAGGTTGNIFIVGNTISGTSTTSTFGIDLGSTTGPFRSVVIQDNIIANFSGTTSGGFRAATSAGFPAFVLWDGNAYYNNTVNRTNADDAGTTNLVNRFAPYANVFDISVGADPFTNSAGGDYTLNNNSQGGAQIRGHGIPGALPGATGTGYLDMGAWQHQDAGGGSAGGARVVGLGGFVVSGQ